MASEFVCAVLSAAAYEDAPLDQELAATVGYDVIERYGHNEAQATLFVPTYDEISAPVLAFRGTEFRESFRDTARNLGWPVAWIGKGKVHSGYWRAYQMLVGRVLELSSSYPSMNITGHSQGGSLATLAAAHLNTSRGRNHPVKTFGAPPCLAKADRISRALSWISNLLTGHRADPGFDLAATTVVDRYFISNDFAPSLPWQAFNLHHPAEKPIPLEREGRRPWTVSAHWIPLYIARAAKRLGMAWDGHVD